MKSRSIAGAIAVLSMMLLLISSLFSFNFDEVEAEPTRADPAIDGVIGASEYEGTINIDDGKFELFWTTTGDTIFLGMRGETEGYLSIGLDPVNIMTNADMIFGWVNDTGVVHVKDAYCTDDTGNHPEDTTFPGGTYDIDEFNGTESGGTTTIELRRAMSTGDPYDKKFVNGTSMKIMWATSNDDDWTQEHDDADYDTISLDGTPPPPPPVSDELDGIISPDEYSNSTSFDSGNFELHWNITGPNITMAIRALTTGWVSLGISPTTMMLGADFIMGGFSGSSAYAEDHYATTTTAHVLDTDLAGGTDDILAYNSTESGGWTILEIKRALSTGDANDKDITMGTPMSIIWGISSSDNLADKHTKVGYGTWRVDASQEPPPPPPPKSDFDGVIDTDEYGNMTKMDSERFELHWKINGSTIDIGIKAQVTGYVSIGIDPTDRMKDADLIFGWVEGGTAHSEDHFSTGATGPHSKDEDLGGTFDIISYNATESGGWTTFEFRRNLSSSETYDRSISTDTEFPLIWAVSDSDDPMSTHTRRGAIMWNLTNETSPPPPPMHISDFDGMISQGEYTDSKMFDSDRFELHWNVSGDVISIGIRAEAVGWISIGLDPDDRMANADMYLGYFDGTPHLLDQYSTGPLGPHPEDSSLGGTFDILDFNVTESNGWTSIEFSRNLTSMDAYDNNISETELMTIIWAVSDSDDPTSLHTRRGTTTWKLESSVTPPPPPPVNTTLDGIVSENEYDDSASFDDGAFEIYWTVNGSNIHMGMVGETTGWISIGFEPTTMMKDADMLIGWVDGSGPGLWDTFSTGNLGPHPRDTELGGTDDIISYNGTESYGITTIEFTRKLDTGDAYDKPIPSSGSLNIIWGIGSSDDPDSSHTSRGSGTLLLYMDEPEPDEGLDGIISAGEYRDSATFDFDNFKVYWSIVDDELHMGITALTTGWIAIGFDPEDSMKDADVVLGWMESGIAHIIDAYSTGQYGPHPPDTHLGGTSDILKYNGTEDDGSTTIEFTRKLSTGDQFDKDIPTSGNMNIMWAYGEVDDFGETHSTRGFAVLTIGEVGEPPVQADLDGIISSDEYDFNGSFGGGLITIHWKVDGDSIRIAIEGKTTGWVSIGIDYTTQMSDSDMIFGWIDDQGTVFVVDAYSTGPTGPHPADTDQGGSDDIDSFGGKEINGITTIEFTRKLDTGDQWDNPIPANGTIKIIWGLGSSDQFNGMHFEVGYGTINITSGETESEEPLKLWPFHAIFMTIGALGMITAWYSQYRKKWRRFLKYHMIVMSGSVISGLTGLIIGYIMVENGSGIHLRVIHSWFGVLAILLAFGAMGLGLYFKYTKKMKHKRPSLKFHRWIGRGGVTAFLIVSISGFYQAMVEKGDSPDVWFIAIEVLILALFIGAVIFLYLKGIKRPEKKKPVEPDIPPPKEDLSDSEDDNEEASDSTEE